MKDCDMWSLWNCIVLGIVTVLIGSGVCDHLKNRKARRALKQVIDNMDKVERP